ncbi:MULTISPECIES: membrane protein insertion efficiency factor YidD [unclassified Campylobacter]|uniref:membrane protein insertion efficiency factor YidD n=1 Tax=unclassified Campylobacter TaxID=2593542 RepID=UPI001237B206|nr:MULTISPECIES: membrane protein insertion efficiency factor YidD [unclassified Campylobacter]KAA6224787.1 membrane protein insertion efficiency factor YidD [Campylobacter sp. LR185c]KAA6228739.1 membrane protein insertion efficiency factor YidD [Campylobacter sp. LR286c]KAA6229549.1 membrane protein insertion efficiency factor YidD [Campylobacter sp. LR264d]KAA6230793.1 membrane protein insertion efficiency factor YidD [Campylobacter sp. LR291e]KAA8604892.1 membrane protein insertion efficie
MFKIICLKILRFYQYFISPLKPNCCRYYPSCSNFAFLQFQKNNIFLAFFATFIRIIKCNPFFKGGFDYPKISTSFQTISIFKPSFLAKKPLRFLYIPYKKEAYYLIKIL